MTVAGTFSHWGDGRIGVPAHSSGRTGRHSGPRNDKDVRLGRATSGRACRKRADRDDGTPAILWTVAAASSAGRIRASAGSVSINLQPVANARDRHENSAFLVSELAAQPVGVGMEVPRFIAVARAPDVLQDHPMCADLADVAR